jgi:kynurenine formamidase
VITVGGPTFPGDPPVEIRPAATIERDGYHVQTLAGEQAGTHWAAPAHFGVGQAAADELDPGDFFYPAVVLDVRAEVKEDPDLTLGVAEITSWEAEFGPGPAHSAVIMWTGFEDRWCALGISRVGNRPGCRHVVRRQPAAAPRASHPPGEPGRPG